MGRHPSQAPPLLRPYAKDLLADRDLRFISRTFPLWVLAGLALPFGLGVALTGTVTGGLTGLLWGGAVRIFLLHHATFSINSLCHYFGRRQLDPGAWLITGLERCHLASDVIRISPERQQAKRGPAAA